jgi:hypothetical protein
MIRATRLLITCGLLVTPSVSVAQAPDAPDGRFQLVSQDGGTMFLLDSASGRVWRYTRVISQQEQQAEEVTEQLAREHATLVAQRRAEWEAEPTTWEDRELELQQRIARLLTDGTQEYSRRTGQPMPGDERRALRQQMREVVLDAEPSLDPSFTAPPPFVAPPFTAPPPFVAPPFVAPSFEPPPESEPAPNPCAGLVAFNSSPQVGSLRSSRISEPQTGWCRPL